MAADPGRSAGPSGPGDWLSARSVGRLTGLPEKKVRRAAELGLLTVRRAPEGLGGMARYSRESVEALARMMVTPATALPPALNEEPAR